MHERWAQSTLRPSGSAVGRPLHLKGDCNNRTPNSHETVRFTRSIPVELPFDSPRNGVQATRRTPAYTRQNRQVTWMISYFLLITPSTQLPTPA